MRITAKADTKECAARLIDERELELRQILRTISGGLTVIPRKKWSADSPQKRL